MAKKRKFIEQVPPPKAGNMGERSIGREPNKTVVPQTVRPHSRSLGRGYEQKFGPYKPKKAEE